MNPEIFPAEVDFQNPWTREEFQGLALSCTRFGLTSALEALAHKAGVNVQLSPKWLWYYRNRQSLSVEESVRTLNTFGVCRDELYPYTVDMTTLKVVDEDVPPGLAAIEDARRWYDSTNDVEVQRIAGMWAVARALAKGSTVITIRINPSGTEHCECTIGYHQDKGMKIQGSGFSIYWEPWSSLTDGTVTQTWAIVKCPWPLTVHPDYREGDIPTFNQGVLWLPKLTVFYTFPTPPDVFLNATVHFTAANTGVFKAGDPDVGADAIWSSQRKWLALPALMYFNPASKLWERWERVSLSNPSVDIISFEKQ